METPDAATVIRRGQGRHVLSRFAGPTGHRLLIDAMRAQRVVGGNETAASALVGAIELRELAAGEVLLEQDEPDNDFYFILSGSLDVFVNARFVGTRAANTHVGDMAVLDPGARRSATVSAAVQSVVGKVGESVFSEVADRHPRMWRMLAVETGERLRQRGRFLRPPNRVPIVFIGSSREALPIATPIRDGLSTPDLEVRLWSDGVFGASRFPIEDLQRQLEEADFAVLVIAPDDRVTSRGRESDAPRDNVIFELGLFMGALSRARTFLAVARGVDLKIPSDLLGLPPLEYELSSSGPIVASACAEVERRLVLLGPR